MIDPEDVEYFTPENEKGESRKEFLSPSGKYKLEFVPIATKGGCWSYTQGKVFRVGSEEPIGVIQRNYSSFPYLFIEDHPSGHDFFLGGEDYQGQSVIDLTTGERRDFLPEDAKEGCGFCAAAFLFDAKSQTMTIHGCIWACPFEFRFYDFSNPMQGWPELTLEGGWFDSDARDPTFNDDGTIVTYQSESPTEEEEAATEEDIDRSTLPIAASKTVRREGDKLVLVSEYVSEKEVKIRAERAEANRLYEEKLAKFRAEDPLYLKYSELHKDPVWSEYRGDWVGVTHDAWCPDFKERERRMGRDIYDQDGLRISLEWGTVTGPIKVQTFGDKAYTRFYPHSVEAMEEAFAFARSLLP